MHSVAFLAFRAFLGRPWLFCLRFNVFRGLFGFFVIRGVGLYGQGRFGLAIAMHICFGGVRCWWRWAGSRSVMFQCNINCKYISASPCFLSSKELAFYLAYRPGQGRGLPGEDKASCTSKEHCGRDDIYDKHKKMHRHPDYSS